MPLTRHEIHNIRFQGCSQKALAPLATVSLPLSRHDRALLRAPGLLTQSHLGLRTAGRPGILRLRLPEIVGVPGVAAFFRRLKLFSRLRQEQELAVRTKRFKARTIGSVARPSGPKGRTATSDGVDSGPKVRTAGPMVRANRNTAPDASFPAQIAVSRWVAVVSRWDAACVALGRWGVPLGRVSCHVLAPGCPVGTRGASGWVAGVSCWDAGSVGLGRWGVLLGRGERRVGSLRCPVGTRGASGWVAGVSCWDAGSVELGRWSVLLGRGERRVGALGCPVRTRGASGWVAGVSCWDAGSVGLGRWGVLLGRGERRVGSLGCPVGTRGASGWAAGVSC